ncbi:hypothetical protein [Hydrogenophaga sp. 5NK40-0174]|uniref:hypothetical protein n=1 Tax=Hydrogenophaga sp. 5NK40-0174 TaxID=3127649 RepID=UPI003108A328
MNESHVYTFVIDYHGGTYLRQNRGHNIKRALHAFMNACTKEKDYDFFHVLATALQDHIDGGQWPVSVDGLDGVWCVSCPVNDHLALINIVETTIHPTEDKT